MNDPDRSVFEAGDAAGEESGAPVAVRGSSGRGAGGGLLEFGERQRRDFERSPRPMRIFDRETMRYVAVNDAALALYGYSRDEFLALTLMDTRHPEEHNDLLESFDRPEGYFMHFEPRRHVKKSGEIFIAEVITQDMLFDGRAARVSLTIDVTERARVLDLVRQREQEFETLAEHLPDLVARFDRSGRYVYANSAVERLTGAGREAILGRTQRDLGMPESVVAVFEESFAEIMRGGAAHKLEFGCRSASGDDRQFEAYHVPERDAHGEIATILCVARDITERKRTEQVSRKNEEFLRRVIESSRDCIKVLELDGRLTWMSTGGQRLMELDDVACVMGRSYLDFWNSTDRGSAEAALAAARAGGVSRFEGYCPSAKGTPRWWDEIVTSILGEDGKPERMLVVSRDVTEAKKAEHALRDAEAERLTQAINQRDALVREVHHRIKNHLQGIAGLLRNKAGDNPAAVETIEAAVAQLQSVAVVYGLQSELAESGVPLCEVLEAICSSAEGLSAARVVRDFAANTGNVRLATEEAVPVAVALNELISNAIEHGTRGGGTPRIEISLSEKKDGADIRIVNSGTLPARFDYHKGISTGTGLGLVRTLLGPSGGDLQFGVGDGRVEVNLSLRHPLVSIRERPAPPAGTPA